MMEAIQGKRIKEESDAMAVQVCVREKMEGEMPFERSRNRWKRALPITVPVKNVASISVNA